MSCAHAPEVTAVTTAERTTAAMPFTMRANRGLSAGPAKQTGLDLRIRRIREPDREQRFRKIVALDRPLGRAVDVDVDADARLLNEGELLAGSHVGHPAVEGRNAVLQCGQVALGILLEAFVPPLLQVVASDVANELQNELPRSAGGKQGGRIIRGLRDIERSDVYVHLECGGLPQAETVQRKRASVDLDLIGKGDPLAFFAGSGVGCKGSSKRYSEDCFQSGLQSRSTRNTKWRFDSSNGIGASLAMRSVISQAPPKHAFVTERAAQFLDCAVVKNDDEQDDLERP
jgi:hypothetical protein